MKNKIFSFHLEVLDQIYNLTTITWETQKKKKNVNCIEITVLVSLRCYPFIIVIFTINI